MDFKDYCRERQHSPYCSRAEAFKLGRQSKQAEIDALKAKIQELWTELDDRQSKEHIIERCELIIQEILK